MRFEKSFFNPTLYKKNLTRFWPLWALYLVIWLFIFPVSLLLDNYGDPVRFAQRDVLRNIQETGVIIALLFSVAVAAAVWSYLCNNRSTCLMHSLPIRREGLFLTNFLSGMTFFVGPNLVIFVLTLLAESVVGYVDAGALIIWLVGVTLMEFFFFCFATFCSMCTGHLLGLPALYAAFNVLVYGLYMLIDLALSRFVFGYDSLRSLEPFAEWMTPVLKLINNLQVRRVTESGVTPEIWQFGGIGCILIYALVGLVLAGLALLLYRRRNMECAGDIITVSWMRPIFQYGVAFCCALAFGSLLYEMFRSALPQTAWTLLAFMLLCGVVGYFAAKMLLEKSFRVLHCWKGCLPFLAALVVLVAVMEFDLTGFERRVPEQGEVAAVEVYVYDTRPYDEASHMALNTGEVEVVGAVLEAHQSFVDNKKSIEQHAHWDGTHLGWSGIKVTYTLANGRSFTRDYNNVVPMIEADLSQPGTPTAAMNKLINLPLMVTTAYGLTDESAENLARITLDNWSFGSEEETEEGKYSFDAVVSSEVQQRLFEAVMADFAEGNLGMRYVGDTQQRMETCFVNNLNLYFNRVESDGVVYGIKDGRPTVTVTEEMPYDWPEAADKYYTECISVGLLTTARHTLAVLMEEGVLDTSVRLATQAQARAADEALQENNYEWNGIDVNDYVWAELEGAAPVAEPEGAE